MNKLKYNITIMNQKIFFLLTIAFTLSMCTDSSSSKTKDWLFASMLQNLNINAEYQRKFDLCMGKSGIICTTEVVMHPTTIRQVELFQNENKVSTSDTTNIQITNAMCNIYYSIPWESNATYRSTKLYLKNSNGEVCGISWEKHSGETKKQLLDLPETQNKLDTLTEIRVDDFRLLFHR